MPPHGAKQAGLGLPAGAFNFVFGQKRVPGQVCRKWHCRAVNQKSSRQVDFFKWTNFSRGAGAFVRKLYGGTHEQSYFQPAGLVNSLQGIRVPTAGFNGSAARFYRHPLF